MKKAKQFIFMALAGFAAFALGGCAAAQKAQEFIGERAAAGYEQAQAVGAQARAAKQRVAEDDLAQTEERVEFASKFGEDIDRAGLSWLDGHLQRVANFVCDLDSRGIVVRDIATRNPDAVARIVCVNQAARGGGDEPAADAVSEEND